MSKVSHSFFRAPSSVVASPVRTGRQASSTVHSGERVTRVQRDCARLQSSPLWIVERAIKSRDLTERARGSLFVALVSSSLF